MSTNTWRRFLGLLLPFSLLLGVFCLPASAGGSRHPYFDDRGTLSWFHTLAEAQSAARRLDKVIFVEYGRRKCSNCRKLAQTVLPQAAIRARIGDAAIGLAAECDRPERAVWKLFRDNLPGARMLPFAAFITADGQWITGWYGHRSVGDVSAHLSLAEDTVRALRAPATCRTPAARPARPAPRSSERSEPMRRAAPTPRPAPCEPLREQEHGDAEECAGGSCEGGNCRPPSFELPRLPNPFELLAPCKPAVCPPTCPPPADEAPRVAAQDGFGDFPPPQARVEEPRRLLAEHTEAVTAKGSPDGASPAAPGPVVMRAASAASAALPAPVIVPRSTPVAALAPISTGAGADETARARAAARRGDWREVLRLTRHAGQQDAAMLSLNRQVHSWAHGRLAQAVGALRERRFDEARLAVNEVSATMRGESLGVDAERGAEAIELVRDLDFLAEKSAVRQTVQRTAYEKMRGTRWAPLFSECAPPGTALTSR